MALFACIMASAQKALFDKYSETDGVSTVYISHKMMRMMGNVKAGNKDISKIASRLDYLQILSCERRSLIPSIKKTAQASSLSSVFRLLCKSMRVQSIPPSTNAITPMGKTSFPCWP